MTRALMIIALLFVVNGSRLPLAQAAEPRIATRIFFRMMKLMN